jgi:glycosyltransferase involved in cell wall biosynthesis
MKILFVLDTYPPNVNGAAIATYNLAKNLAKRNHKIFIATTSTNFKSSKKEEDNQTIYRIKSVPIIIERTQKFRISPKPLHKKELEKIILEVNPDIIHINEPMPLGLSAIKLARENHIPIVIGHHFMPENLVHYLHLPKKIEDTLTKKIWDWYGNICSKADLVISPTQTAEDILLNHEPSIKHTVISNGIDLQKFNQNNTGEYLQKRYKIPAQTTLLFIGRLDKEKNIDILIRAIAKIVHKFPFHTVIVGQGKEEKSLKELALKLGVYDDITFTGYLPEKDLPNIYKVADIFVMPSIAELQSLVTMEAMACGLPIIGADAVALPHLIHKHENGLLFEPGNASDLAQKLQVLLTDKKMRQKMAKESLKIIREHDNQKVIEQIEKTYQQTIKNYIG